MNQNPGGHLLCFFLLFLTVMVNESSAQHESIHRLEQMKWNAMGALTATQYDSIHGFDQDVRSEITLHSSVLEKRVFGYHPFWSGNVWKNYQWHLLTDLCYFSYEVDALTGNPVSDHGWATDPVIDTALAHGVKVHLCVTLFSGHSTFFNSPVAQQNLAEKLISRINSRGAQGINLDFESIPASQQAAFTACVQFLAQTIRQAIPDIELSIAVPAVNWNNTFDMPALSSVADFFVIMAYDYYWNGSSLAGPVSGLWPMVATFSYGVSASLTYYQSQGVPVDKLILGQPYYGREWPVNGDILPALTTGQGVALTYRVIRNNNSGYYNRSNLKWDPYSFNPYFSYNSAGWRQCFFDDTRSLEAKYNMVNRRGIAGIGIWALGYDNGYEDLWQLIADKFTGINSDACADSLLDTGGPYRGYVANQLYTEIVKSMHAGPLQLSFHQLDLEPGYDSLWIYDGTSESAPLLYALSGNVVPPPTSTTTETFMLRFLSKSATDRQGYILYFACPTAGISDKLSQNDEVVLFPHPASEEVFVKWDHLMPVQQDILIYDLHGSLRIKAKADTNPCRIALDCLTPGFYIVHLKVSGKAVVKKLLIN